MSSDQQANETTLTRRPRNQDPLGPSGTWASDQTCKNLLKIFQDNARFIDYYKTGKKKGSTSTQKASTQEASTQEANKQLKKEVKSDKKSKVVKDKEFDEILSKIGRNCKYLFLREVGAQAQKIDMSILEEIDDESLKNSIKLLSVILEAKFLQELVVLITQA